MPGRVALVGAGAFGRFCIDAYRRSGDIEVVAVVDPDDGALARVDGTMRRERDWRSVVFDHSVEVVHLATPPHVRADVVDAALRSRKSVFCEKPLALTLAQADQMIGVARQAGVGLGVDYVMRHLPAYHLLEALAGSGLFGPLRTISFQNFAQMVPSSHWFWDREKSGGIFVEHGVHFFDAYARIAGPAGLVWGATPRREAVEARVQYRDGAVGRFFHEFAFPREVERAEGVCFFERGYVAIEGWIPTRLHGSVMARPREVEAVGRGLGLSLAVNAEPASHFETSFPDRDRSYGDAIVAGMREMIRRHREPAYRMTVQPEDARASLGLALAAQRAADTGQPIEPRA